VNDFRLGEHTAQITALALQVSGLEKNVAKMDGKLDQISIALAERRGERKAIAFFATAAGGLGSFLMTMLLKLWGHQ